MVERRNFDKNWQQSWQQNHHLNNAWSRMKTWRILTAKLLFKHGNNPDNLDILDNPDNKTIVQTRRLVFTWSSASSSWVLVWNLLKSFWNNHYSERSTFEVIIIKKNFWIIVINKVLLRSQLVHTCPKENGHRCLKSGWKQVGGTWSAVAARPTRPPILYISLYVMVSIRYIVCKNIYIYNNILVDPHVRQYTILFHSCREYIVSGIFFQSFLWLLR